MCERNESLVLAHGTAMASLFLGLAAVLYLCVSIACGVLSGRLVAALLLGWDWGLSYFTYASLGSLGLSLLFHKMRI